ncbi:hypothetical protein JTB14_026622 [Gonioctena quinquepunctata]|nr:hypothetical protein JTB14_026622 [Gonioctena quinquepunctata]
MNDEQFNILLKTLTESLIGSRQSTSTKVIQLEPFCGEMFINRLENFTGTPVDIDNKTIECLIHSMGTKTLQPLYILTSPDEPKNQIISYIDDAN